jgi:hypothetical protein
MEAGPEATAPAAAVRIAPPRKRKRHRLEENPPPPIRALTVEQEEAEHPGLQGKLRDWIKRAYADDPDFAGLKFSIIRVGRSIFIDDIRFRDWLYQRTALPPAQTRNPEGNTRVVRRERRSSSDSGPKARK